MEKYDGILLIWFVHNAIKIVIVLGLIRCFVEANLL